MNAPFSSAAMGNTILRVQQELRIYLSHHTDSFLKPEDDPFQRDDHGSGLCFIGMASKNKEEPQGPHRFKYSHLLANADALFVTLFRTNRRFEAIWQTKENRIILGYGKIPRHNVPHEANESEVEPVAIS